MSKLPTFSSSYFTWKQGRAVATLGKLGLREWPRKGFYIKSHKTGATRLFITDEVANCENEFFDGEAMAFMCPGGGLTCQLYVGDTLA